MRKTPSFLVFLLFYYKRMDILRKNKGCRDFLDSLREVLSKDLSFIISLTGHLRSVKQMKKFHHLITYHSKIVP
ncbi:hypothetical protein CTZ29_21240, partial [Bacillus halotolerans]